MMETQEKIQKEDTDWLLDRKKSRAITQEILAFGVSQEQIKNIRRRDTPNFKKRNQW